MSQQKNELETSMKHTLFDFINYFINKYTNFYTIHNDITIIPNISDLDNVKEIFTNPKDKYKIGKFLIYIFENESEEERFKIQKMCAVYDNNIFMIIYVYTFIIKDMVTKITDTVMYCDLNVISKFLYPKNLLFNYISNNKLYVII